MINITLLWLLLIPLALSIVSFLLLPKLAAHQFDKRSSLGLSVIGLLISSLIITTFFMIGSGSRTSDQQLLNGEITNKARKHDSYVRSYSCRCRQECSGSGDNKSCSEVCDTCYEDRYTVTWTANSTIGDFTINHEDSGLRSVYNTPDSKFYSDIVRGDPCAKVQKYTNYIKAVPESLFRPNPKSVNARFAASIPNYPITIHNYYNINRVIPVGLTIPDLATWNKNVSMALRKLGPEKQANIVIVISNQSDPAYFYALRDAWLNGKKNDIVVVIGAPEFPKQAAWVDVMALTNNPMVKIKIQDDIMDMVELTPDAVVGSIENNVRHHFARKSMRDFAYLEAEIDPPLWLTVTTMLSVVLAYFGFWFYTYYYTKRTSYSRFSIYSRFK